MIDPLIYEEYRPITSDIIPGVENGRYLISNFGNLFDNKRNCFCSKSKSSNGYYVIYLNIDGKPTSFLLHRIVALVFVPGDTSLIVNHKDGIKENCIYTNLEWSTHSDNNYHAFNNGLSKRGEDSPKSIITEEQANMICKCLDEQILKYDEIAAFCGINSPDAISLISAIRRGESWTHVSYNYNFSKNYKGSRYRPINRNRK